MPCMWLKVTALTFGEIEEQTWTLMRSLKLDSDLQYKQPIKKELLLALQWQIWVKNYQECLTGCLLVSYLVERSTCQHAIDKMVIISVTFDLVLYVD